MIMKLIRKNSSLDHLRHTNKLGHILVMIMARIEYREGFCELMKTIQNSIHDRNQLEMTTLKTLLKIWYGVVSSEKFKTSLIL